MLSKELTEPIDDHFIDMFHIIRPLFINNNSDNSDNNHIKKIDLICLKREFEPLNFIENYFDFDFLKCYYNGNEIIHLKPQNGLTKQCKLTELNIIKLCKINPFYIRQYAYFIATKDRFQEARSDPLNILKRIKKYESRGFVIDTQHFKITIDKKSPYHTRLTEEIDKLLKFSNLPNKK